MNKILFITNLLMGCVLSRFAISKLTGWEISIQAFIEMAKPLGLDPTFFRVSTGIIIAAVVIAYLTTAIFSLLRNNTVIKSKVQFTKWATFSNLFGLLTMTGALIAEFSLRVHPKWLLVYIACTIIIFSVLNIIILNVQSITIINKQKSTVCN
ncbi:MAG: hypothetical protein CMD31_06995 [Flavobacteriales bacterium]|jgi:hypothetical protein|nr:hypothetical protein [Flavobacteriales bacterium]MBL1232913.1 hypothetical protein [Flavobacteriales bacterium]MBQ20489.1 hypothetical protein [Flavobacteriales bacterium]|tara:strand:+ start:213171 stop:213629 length:459 start_codon:yes stop_codon:yes gene_type:complete